MLGKFAPLHSTPPGCCISRAALLKLLGCQVAPKLTGTRNAHGLLHSPGAAAAVCLRAPGQPLVVAEPSALTKSAPG